MLGGRVVGECGMVGGWDGAEREGCSEGKGSGPTSFNESIGDMD